MTAKHFGENPLFQLTCVLRPIPDSPNFLTVLITLKIYVLNYTSVRLALINFFLKWFHVSFQLQLKIGPLFPVLFEPGYNRPQLEIQLLASKFTHELPLQILARFKTAARS